MLFGKKKQPELTKQQAMAARPVQLVKSECVTGSDPGTFRLVVPLKTRKFAGFLFRMPEGATKSFELDEMGKLVWDSCDGSTSVQQIIRRLADEYRISHREAEVSTLAFLRTLARKGLLGFSGNDVKMEDRG